MNRKGILLPLIAMACIMLLWELLVVTSDVSELILPPPSAIWEAFWSQKEVLLTEGLITLWEAFAGFCLGSIAAGILAFTFLFFPISKTAFYPLAIGFRAVPVIAIAPLIVVWAGVGLGSKIIMAAIISFFPVLVNMIKGLSSVSSDELEYFKSLSASKWQEFKHLRVPRAAPDIFAGLKIASSFSVIGAIVAEFTGASRGIGYLIKSSTYYANTDLTFAAIFIAAIIGVLFFYLVVLAEKLVIFWDSTE